VFIFESVGARQLIKAVISQIVPPYGVIEKSCKAYPEDVRYEKQSSLFAYVPEPDDTLHYEKPEEQNYYECGQGRLQTKKGVGPENIDQELKSKYAQGNFGVNAAYPLLPDQEKRQTHESKENDPYDRDDRT
jgi:hypothetical protein